MPAKEATNAQLASFSIVDWVTSLCSKRKECLCRKVDRCTSRNYVLTDYVLSESVKYVHQYDLILDQRFLHMQTEITAISKTPATLHNSFFFCDICVNENVTKMCPLGPIQQTYMCVGHIWTRLTMKRRYIPCNMVVNADLLFVVIAYTG